MVLWLALPPRAHTAAANDPPTAPVRYTRHHVQAVLQFMGCKTLHAVRITDAVFAELDGDGERATTVPLAAFEAALCEATTALHYAAPSFLSDFEVARQVKDQERPLCILLGGTSGCGKSTLGSLLASRLGITTVLSTDHVRHLLRSVVAPAANPVLWASSYHAGDALSEAAAAGLSPAQRVITGYVEQSRALYDHLETVIAQFQARCEPLIVEGVHLTVDLCQRLQSRFPSCVPFLIYISNETKHTERFAIRAKYMTVEARTNKYIHYFASIRTIQDYLCHEAAAAKMPQVDNTNVDRSLAIIHRTVFTYVRYLAEAEAAETKAGALDASMPRDALDRLYNRISDMAAGSKAMLRVIRQKRRQARAVATAVPTPPPAAVDDLAALERETVHFTDLSTAEGTADDDNDDGDDDEDDDGEDDDGDDEDSDGDDGGPGKPRSRQEDATSGNRAGTDSPAAASASAAPAVVVTGASPGSPALRAAALKPYEGTLNPFDFVDLRYGSLGS